MHKWIILIGSWAALSSTAWGGEAVGARIIGMGGAGAALPEEAATVYWNPAGLYFINNLASDFTFQFRRFDWPENWGMSYVNYSGSHQRGGGLGIYRQKVNSPDTVNFGDAVMVQLATVYLLPLRLPLGLSAKYINENWEDAGRKSYLTTDVGTGYQVGGLYIGACFQSLTQPDSRIFPYRVLGGASFELGDRITLAAQAVANRWSDVEDLDPSDWGAGAEITPYTGYSFQAGRREVGGQRYWTFGIGLGQRRGMASLYASYLLPDPDHGERSLFVSYVFSP